MDYTKPESIQIESSDCGPCIEITLSDRRGRSIGEQRIQTSAGLRGRELHGLLY